jgi:hypothetical protein
MRRRLALGTAAALLPLAGRAFPATQVRADDRSLPAGIGRVEVAGAADRVGVYPTPGDGRPITRLPRDAQLQLTGEARGPDGQAWYAVRLWNALEGFVPQDALAFTTAPYKAPGSVAPPWKPPPAPAQGPFPLDATAVARTDWEFAAAPDGPGIGALVPGGRHRLTAWATDSSGRAWYGFAAEGGLSSHWTPSGALALELPDRAPAGAGGVTLAQGVAGKGMWFTYETVRQTPPEHLVATALANGLSFLAPEVGTSRRGYWAGAELDALLGAAHGARLRVIPWVYTWLADLPGDLALALRAARHVSPTGEAPDGIAVDIEENLDEGVVRTFGQLLRGAVGPARLLVAITFQPQHSQGRRTPYPAIAETFDVVAPMSYWHLRDAPYGYAEAYAYVAESVRLIRERTGQPDLPVTVLGQTFDWFTRGEIGAGNPTADEVRGAMQGARDAGALGIGFFDWFSATPEEWEALGSFGW